MRSTRALVAGLAAIGLILATPTMASAGGKKTPAPEEKSTAVVAPFNLAFSGKTLYVADGGLNLVGKLAKNGTITTVAAGQPGASGVARSRDGRTLAFTTTVTDFATFTNTDSGLNLWGPKGKRIYADTLAYETAKNPDSRNHYGVVNPSQCVRDAFDAAGFPVDYTGAVDSHAYSVTGYGSSWIVADAGANALWRIDSKGRIRTLAVLPPQKLTLTAEMVAGLGMPSCVVGATYAFEPVPTDVEVGRDGKLYVTLLPGGPEGPQLGARGALYNVDPRTGAAKKVAGGFLGATNLAIGRGGEVYVAELFGGKISVVKKGKVKTFVQLPGAVAVETNSRGEVWAATMASESPAAPGTIVKITGGHVYKKGVVRR